MAVSVKGRFKNNVFIANDRYIIPDNAEVIVTIIDDNISRKLEEKFQQEANEALWRSAKIIQEDSVKNGTDKFTLDEINDMIAECRQETGTGQ